MAATYPLRIVSREEKVFEGQVESVVAPGALGYLGVLAHHAPLLTSLTSGRITVRDAQNVTHEFRVQGGILEVSTSQVTILADRITSAAPS